MLLCLQPYRWWMWHMGVIQFEKSQRLWDRNVWGMKIFFTLSLSSQPSHSPQHNWHGHVAMWAWTAESSTWRRRLLFWSLVPHWNRLFTTPTPTSIFPSSTASLAPTDQSPKNVHHHHASLPFPYNPAALLSFPCSSYALSPHPTKGYI